MTTSRLVAGALPALAAGAGLTGCGITNPYQHVPANTTRPTSLTATSPTTAASTLASTAPSGAPSPQAALERYSRLAINWTSRTLASDQRLLASLSSGAARAQALQTAATYGYGSSLQHSQVTNRGQITSIAAGQGPTRGEWVITTREQTAGTGDYVGLPAQSHVYYAQVQHTPTGWDVSTWSAQN